MGSIERVGGGRPASARNRDGHQIHDDSLFVLGATPVFTRKANKAPYLIGPTYQEQVRRGFLEHGSAMIGLLSLHERQLLLRDLLRAVRVGSRPEIIDDIKLMIAQTLDQSKLPAEVIRDELTQAAHVAKYATRIKPTNIAALIEVAEMIVPYLPPTDETVTVVTDTFSHTIALVEQKGGTQLRDDIEAWRTRMVEVQTQAETEDQS